MSKFVMNWNLSNIFNLGITNTSYTTTIQNEGVVPWDGTKFDNISAIYLEVVMRKASDSCSADGVPQVKMDLYDHTAGATISGSEITTNSTAFTVIRSGDIKANMPGGAAKLGIRFRVTRSGCMSGAYKKAHLIIVLENSTKFRILVDIGAFEFTSSTSYAEITNPKRWLYTSGNYDATTTISYGSCAKNNTASIFVDEIFVKLVNKTDNSDVAGGEISEPPDSTYAYYQTGTVTLTTAKEFTTHIKTGGSLKGSGTTIANAHLIIDHSVSPTKTELPHQLMTELQIETSTSYVQYDFMLDWDTADFVDVTKSLFHEGVLLAPGGQTSFMDILDDGTPITNAEISTTTSSFVRIRSSAMTEPADGSELEHQQKITSGTGKMASSRIINVLTNITYPSVGTNMQLQIGDNWKTVDAMQINIGDTWKTVDGAQINIGDTWKTIF